ncbi:MAG: DUF1343 domain-containing protein [Phycisphaerae bacterium]|nr:DUF1343 domain-containing protein [Phycisphaerae bacterium]
MARKILVSVALIWLAVADCPAAVTVGLDKVRTYASLLNGKRVGIICNHTAVDSDGRHIVEVFQALPGVKVTALFGPEHGIYGLADAGKKIGDNTDERYGIPIFSLYGKTSKPTPEMLAEVDVLIFDIQDVGSRFYTYIWTMALAMEAAAENSKLFIVMDRPNPIGGIALEGPILEKQHATFVGLYPIPVRHGMTVGELARMFNGENWLKEKARLLVVPVGNWRRSQWYDETGLEFIKPSPNMPDLETAAVYPGLCLLEGTNLSEGRGTNKPFLQFGAPWIDEGKLVEALNKLRLPGVRFVPAAFTPTASKHANALCKGAAIEIADRTVLEPFRLGVEIVNTLYRMYPDQFEWRQSHFDRLCGTSTVREAIVQNVAIDSLAVKWQKDMQGFQKTRQRYLLYR